MLSSLHPHKSLIMLKQLLPACLLLSSVTFPAVAQSIPTNRPVSQAQPTPEALYQACTQNRAETLPNPFTDVSSRDWAYKAVLTMHYCGAFRQAAPRSLFERSQPAPQSVTPSSTTNSQQ